jgi:hypothetical protein
MLIKQPNGLYCIFDTIDNQPKKWNITREKYISKCIKNAVKNAKKELSDAEDIHIVCDNFMPNENMTEEDFNRFLKEIGCDRDLDFYLGTYDD